MMRDFRKSKVEIKPAEHKEHNKFPMITHNNATNSLPPHLQSILPERHLSEAAREHALKGRQT